MHSIPLNRRHALRQLGACISLPFLESMLPRSIYAAEATRPPVRLVWLYAMSGMWMPSFKPEKTGRDFALTPTLEPLAPLREHVNVLTGLLHANAFLRNPATGRHGQDPLCHLTAADLGRVPGVASQNSISIDQIAAQLLGEFTRIPSLALGAERSGTINFTSTGSPIPLDWNPWQVFQRLFAGTSVEDKKKAEERFLQKKSILDGVVTDTQRLNARLGASDRAKVDEFLNNVREVERRAEVARKWADVPLPKLPDGIKPPPQETPERKRGEHIRLLLDLIVLALQTDQTRVATAMIGYMGCSYPEIGCPDGYHGYTHHDNKADKQQAMAKVDRARVGHVAYFLEKLNAIREADGSTLLDNCLVHFGGGMGSWHESTDLGNFIAGHGGGKLKLGEHLDFKQTPLANLYVMMMQAAGVPLKTFVDSKGPLGIS